MKRKRLKYTCVPGDIQNTVDEAYDSFPDRIYIVGKVGKIALQGAPGPMGFPDTIKKVKKWLRDYKKQMKAVSTKTEG